MSSKSNEAIVKRQSPGYILLCGQLGVRFEISFFDFDPLQVSQYMKRNRHDPENDNADRDIFIFPVLRERVRGRGQEWVALFTPYCVVVGNRSGWAPQ